MIVGIVEAVGKILDLKKFESSLKLKVKTNLNLQGFCLGDSIAINGVCLTVVNMDRDIIFADVVNETILKTNLKYLEIGSDVNVERMAKIGDRINGHIVQGHVDACSRIKSIRRDNSNYILKIDIPKQCEEYLVYKGSICIDGMSITIVEVEDGEFTVALIPHTIENTIAKNYRVGDWVNLEVDMIAKYLNKLIVSRYGTEKI